MSYYRKTTLFFVVGIALIVVGLATFTVAGTTSGLVIFNGVVFLGAAWFHKSKPLLKLEDDHLQYDGAMLRSTKLVAREDIESIDTLGKRIEIHVIGGDVIKLPANEIVHTSPDELERELNDWIAVAA